MTANYADQYNNGEIEEVFPRIWRVPVPLPDNPLNYLNSYFILSEDKTTIIDVGFDHPDCEKALDDALHKLGRTWESVEIVLTHSHPDHTSNLDRIWRRWMRIYANMHSIQEVQNLMNMQATVFNPLIGYLTHPNTYDERSMQARDASTYRVSAELLPLKNQPDLFYLADGDVYHNGSYRFRVITTPGRLAYLPIRTYGENSHCGRPRTGAHHAHHHELGLLVRCAKGIPDKPGQGTRFGR